jgi:hypothetical protein
MNILFGDKKTFAISYKPDEMPQEVEEKVAFPYCHFVFQNQIIGFENERCYLGVWAPSLYNLRNKIVLKRGCLREPAFEGLSDIELFELIEKCNQQEDEFKREYLYLPQLQDDVWCKYRLDMDHTIDSFGVLILEEQEQLKFLWRNNKREGDLGTLRISHAQFLETVNECLEFLVAKYPMVLHNLLAD